jgi:hypothetical protein
MSLRVVIDSRRVALGPATEADRAAWRAPVPALEDRAALASEAAAARDDRLVTGVH